MSDSSSIVPPLRLVDSQPEPEETSLDSADGPNVVDSLNTLILVAFISKVLKSPQLAQLILEALPRSPEYYRKEGLRFPISHWRQAAKMLVDNRGTRAVLEQAGATSADLESWGRRASTFAKVLGRAYQGPIAAYRWVPVLNRDFNDTKDWRLVEEIRDKATGQITEAHFCLTFKTGIEAEEDWVSDPWIRGILKAITRPFGLPLAEVSVPVLPYDVIKLLEMEYDIEAEFDRDTGELKIDEEVYGRRVYICQAQSPAGPYWVDEYDEEFCRGRNKPAVLITRDLVISEPAGSEWTVLTQGEIYYADSFFFKVKWQPMPRWRQAMNWLVGRPFAWWHSFWGMREENARLRELIANIKAFGEEVTRRERDTNEALLKSQRLEAQAREEAEAAQREAESAYAEAAHYRELAQAYLAQIHPTEEITTRLLHGLMEAREQELAVMFTDLKGSTAFAARHTPAEVFAAIDDHLVQMSRVVDRNHGYVVKNTGDGMLVVFGLRPSPNSACLDALRAALEMQMLMQREAIFQMRIGLDYGPVMVGALLGQVDVLSKVVSAASRVCDYVAGPGEICVMHYFQEELPGALPGTMWQENEDVELKNLGPRSTYTLVAQGEDES